ncbi:hypothetical protein EYC80_009863 [Monilinia laxa]|uniref:Uncharacterized protein n=1 Tax=Monilinia laxa TaxID=61186 RepID=A0A5N6JTI6_MONLA|nr:hypothetical protein EYC80_009863 [Monilinia laxa]
MAPSSKTDSAIENANNQYKHRITQLMENEREKKTEEKLNNKSNSKPGDLADGHSSSSATIIKVTKSLTQLATDEQQMASGSNEWKAASDGFVESSKAIDEEERLFWS